MRLRSLVVSVMALMICIACPVSGAELQVLDAYRRVSAFDHPLHNQDETVAIGQWTHSESVSGPSKLVTTSQTSIISSDGFEGRADLQHLNFTGAGTSDMIATAEMRVVFSVTSDQLVNVSGALNSTSSAVGNMRLQLTSAAPGGVDRLWMLDDATSLVFDEDVLLSAGAYELRAYGYANNAPPGQTDRSWEFVFQPVPEPSSLAMLGILSVILVRRR